MTRQLTDLEVERVERSTSKLAAAWGARIIALPSAGGAGYYAAKQPERADAVVDICPMTVQAWRSATWVEVPESVWDPARRLCEAIGVPLIVVALEGDIPHWHRVKDLRGLVRRGSSVLLPKDQFRLVQWKGRSRRPAA